MVVYDSEARKKHQAAAMDNFDAASSVSVLNPSATGIASSLWRSARGAARAAAMSMSLRCTVDSLISGQHIECKDLDELMGAEGQITDATKTTKAYLELAQTFDGREEVLEF